MQLPRSWCRDAAVLAVGFGLGLVAARGLRTESIGKVLNVSGTGTAHGITAAVPFASGPLSAKPLVLRSRQGDRARSAPDWELAALEYRAQNGDISRARSYLYQLDPKGLRKLALDAASWPHGRRTWRAMREIFQQWARLDPGAALAQAQGFPDPELSNTALWATMNGFAEVQPAQAVAFLAAPPGANDRSVLSSLSDRSLMLGSALMSWAEQDGPAAAAYLSQLPVGTVSSAISARVAEEWARQDPANALNWAMHLGDSGMHAEALEGVVSTWAAMDPDAAARYVLGLSPDPGQAALAKSLVESWAGRDLPTAARWVTEQSGNIQAKAAAVVAGQWANQDPTGAAAWAGGLPTGEARNGAYASVAAAWDDHDPTAVQGWINSLPTGDGRDAALASYAISDSNEANPADVLRQVQTIDNPTKRDDTLVTVLNGWLENHPQDAQQWIAQANLPATVTGRLKGG